MESDIEYCAKMLAEEERQADLAPNNEAAEFHLQMAMLYQAQFRVLKQALPDRSSDNRSGLKLSDVEEAVAYAHWSRATAAKRTQHSHRNVSINDQ